MKALFNRQSAENQGSIIAIIALVLFTPFLFPQLVRAEATQTDDQTALVFNIKDPKVIEPQTQTNHLSFDQIVKDDPLVKNLQAYLETKGSPLAPSAQYIVTQKHWELALAISFVESEMCQHTPKYVSKGKVYESYNCSGIGGDNYKRYSSYEDWFSDMNNLLDQPNYVNRPIEKFIGYYVVPGSSHWLNGVRQVNSDLLTLEQQSQQERVAMTGSGQLSTAVNSAELAQVK